MMKGERGEERRGLRRLKFFVYIYGVWRRAYTAMLAVEGESW